MAAGGKVQVFGEAALRAVSTQLASILEGGRAARRASSTAPPPTAAAKAAVQLTALQPIYRDARRRLQAAAEAPVDAR